MQNVRSELWLLGRLLNRIVAERESALEGTICIIRERLDHLGRY